MVSVSSGGAMLERDEENDAEVRREDQDRINKFGSLNARLHELRDEKENMKKILEGIDDASTELMMMDSGGGGGGGENVMLMVGEAFLEASEESATEHCEAEVEKYQAMVDGLEREETAIVEEQAELKRILYARFGKSIQLEE